MDEQRFDQITKRLGTARTRRATLKGLGVALLGAAGIATGLEAEAKGKGKRHGTSGRVATCNLGACQTNTDCTCAGVETCGNNGQCCRTTIGIYCNPTETGSACCSPRYVCTPGTTFQNAGTDSFGCQCNTAEGFVLTNGVCCIPTGSTGNANHPDLCCSGCVVDGKCADASHCQQPQCVAAGQTCNACHSCCDGSTCTDPTHVCNGSGGTCCLNNGQSSQHQELCCSGCVVDGKCADATHCQQTQCVALGQTCNACHSCCAADGSVCTDPTHACNGSGGTCECPTGTHESDGKCVPDSTCTGGKVPCGNQCIDPTTQCCADEEIGVLCPDGKKCCPAGHTCNRNKNGTYNCGKGNGVRGRHGRGRNSR